MAARVKIYTTPWCGYCNRAKALLERKGIAYDETDVDGDTEKRAWLVGVANGRRTVPVIFIDDNVIGGCDELHAMEAAGELDELFPPTE